MTDRERLEQFTTLIGKEPRRTKFNDQEQLIELDLAGLDLTELPPQIGQFQHLTHLYLGRLFDHDGTHINLGNPLTSLPVEVWQLQNLQKLSLHRTKLTSLPAEVAQLQTLQRLYPSQTRLTNLPAEVVQLQNLQRLDLSQTKLKSLPVEVTQLQNLQWLYLHGTRLTSLPAEVAQLQNLQWLDLTKTKLTSLPPEIRQLNELEWLDLADSKLPLPPEILANPSEPQTILDYYFQAHKPLNEAKLLLVGQGSVGKTSLVKRLIEDAFEPLEAKTEGINIRAWQMDLDNTEIQLNIWDFGGQEIMHATHQFFLTHRSLYLLLLDARQGEQEGRLEYWLKIIRSFGGDSPVIVVINKCDEHLLSLDERGLSYKYYPNLKAFVHISCKTGLGIQELKEQIRQELAEMKHIGDLIPPTWLTIKERLEGMEADYLPIEQYAAICEEESLESREEQSRLIRLLHDLGIALNYQDDRLQDTNELKPEWVTNGIYQIINSPELANCDGMLTRSQLASILDSERYPRSKQLFIIDMMRKFELCFSAEGYSEQQFLVPDLLPKERPDFTWQEEANLAFEYHYDILPSSILSRFIVRMHTHVLPRKAWRSGVVLADGKNQARIIADAEENKLYISVGGQKQTRRTFLAVIRSHFEHIHHTIRGIKAEEMVPLSGHANQVIAYQNLLSYEEVGDLTPWWPNINARLDVRQLLDGVGRPEPEPSDEHGRRHRNLLHEPQEAWRENRWLREEEARQEEARKKAEQEQEERLHLEAQAEQERRRAEEERQRAEEERKQAEQERQRAEEERKQAEQEQKQKRYEELAIMREPIVRDAERKAKQLIALYLSNYILFCLVFMLLLFGITYLLSDDLFNRLGLAIDFGIAMIVLPAAAWATSHYLKLDSLWPPSDVQRQLEEGEFKALCDKRRFPEEDYQALAEEFQYPR